MAAAAGLGHNRPWMSANAQASLLSTALVLIVACVPTSRAEPGPSATPPAKAEAELEVAAADHGEAEAEGSDATPEPEALVEAELDAPVEAREPEPEVRDSNIKAGFIVDPAVQPGLVNFSKEMAQEGSLWIGQLEGNGGRDVLIYIPPGTDDGAEFELVYHFHGTYSEHVEQKKDGLKKREWVGWNRLEQTLAAIVELQAKQPENVALIYPFSAGKRLEPGHRGWSNVAYDRMWMDPVQPPDYRDSFDKLHAEVVAILVEDFGVHKSKLARPVLAEGHSAGGIALYNIALNGSDHVGEYLFMDASFQGWADGTYEAIKDSGSSAIMTMVVTETGMADPYGRRDPWCVTWEEDAAWWKDNRGACRGKPEDTQIAERELSCAELEERAEEWGDTYADWCAAYKDDMKAIPEVRLVRTRVYHGEQPRHFSGGLEVPEDLDG